MALICVITVTACKPETNELPNNDETPPAHILFDGDIVGAGFSCTAYDEQMVEYTYEKDGEEIKNKGWDLQTFLDEINEHQLLRASENYLMITSATDGVSALIDANLTDKIYLYSDGEGIINVHAPNYPKCTNIKNVSEITVIAKDPNEILEPLKDLSNTPNDYRLRYAPGLKILTEEKTDFITYGEAKLKLFSKTAENIMGKNRADKYMPDTMTVNSFTGRDNNVLYLANGNIIKNADNTLLAWRRRNIIVKDTGDGIKGIATNATKTILDVFDEMKTSGESSEKVMLIITDGFSWIQANIYENDLDILKASLSKGCATSTYNAISPVALASMLTGQPPSHTGINFSVNKTRAVLKPYPPDVFYLAKYMYEFDDREIKMKYIEGNGNLIITSIDPIYSLSDNEAYENAKTAISEGTDLIVVHFHEIDDVNHQYGPLSQEAKIKCIEIDSYVKDLKMQFDGKVIVVSDHGHMEFVNEDGNIYGAHGYFDYQDMYVPYFVFNN